MKMVSGIKLFAALPLVLQLFGCAIATKDVAEGYFNGLESTAKAPYSNWLNDHFGTAYTQHSFLSTSSASGSGAAVFWKIIEDDINFAIVARATGWLAFGISEAGGMLGSDVIYYETANPDQVVDSYILESRAAPLKDDCQNWNLISEIISDGWLILEVSRKLDTGDNQDHKIMNDAGAFVAPTRLIAAWGDTPTISYHGTNAARNSVRLFADDSVGVREALTNQLSNAAAGFFDVTENKIEIPAEDTTYITVCRTADDILQEIGFNETPLTTIGAMPIITEETRAFVHHFTAYSQETCNTDTLDKNLIYAWAPGDEGWALPANVGFPIFESDNRQAISVEIHYNNPELVSGQIDSSGIRLFFINGERDERAAVLELGDPTLSLYGEQMNNGLTQYDFSCPGTCSSAVLQRSVTVLSEYLHMHQTGIRMTNQVIRNNDVVHSSKVDVFEFDQQGAFHVQQEPYEVKPGDSFRTSCYYRDGAEFGLSSQEEMCIAFVMYYPAKAAGGLPWMCPYGLPVAPCSQELDRFDLDDEQYLDRVFGSSNGKCEATDVDPTMKPTLAPTYARLDEPSSGGSAVIKSAFLVTILSASFLLLAGV